MLLSRLGTNYEGQLCHANDFEDYTSRVKSFKTLKSIV